ncbi:MAG: arylesterase [Gammaproteobacteria bacterium]|nr:arylesterase [Gammaproteobacteria bacterium]
MFLRAWILILSVCLSVPAAHAAQAPAGAAAPTVLVFGNSLSAAYGLSAKEGWVSLLAQRLQREGYGYRVVNASVSGETTAGGLSRLPRALQLHQPAVVILELGGNDALRGLPLATTRDNLEKMLQLSQRAGARVLLLGIRVPPNYGPRYSRDLEQVYRDLAARYRVPLVPFFLDGVALNPQLMQTDGLHPNAAAQPQLLANVWPLLQGLLRKR